MSRERARRRAEREALAVRERLARERRRSRRLRWRRPLDTVWSPIRSRFARRRRPDSALRRMRSRQNTWLAAGLLAGNGILWLWEPSWSIRVVALVASIFAWPVLVVMLFDRRPTV